MFDFALISYWPWVLVASGSLGFITGLICRLVQKAGAGGVVLGLIESTIYSISGAFGGLIGGLFFSYLLPGGFFTLVGLALGTMCLAGIGLGIVHGSGNAGRKVLGTLVQLVFAGVFATLGILAWGVDRNDGLAAGLCGFLALSGGFMGLMFAVYKSAHIGVGWLLTFLNGSWGAIGNLLGFLLHLGSWTFFSPTAAAPRAVYRNSERKFFHCWQNGMRVLPNYYFSLGPVMTAEDDHGMWHEAAHVIQHYLLGPIMPISYAAWLIVMGFIGAIVGLVKGNGLSHGAFAWGYVNNPLEVWEYESTLAGVRKSARRVSADVVKAGKTNTDMVFGLGLAWTLTVLYLVLWVTGFVLLLMFGGT